MKEHPALPPPVSRPWIAVAVVVWIVTFSITVHRSPPAIPAGRFDGEVALATDLFQGRWGTWAIGETKSGVVLMDFDEVHDVGRGDRLIVIGASDGERGTAAGHSYGATLDVGQVVSIEASRFPPHLAGRFIRRTVIDRLQPFDDGRALLAGFLIGDTTQIEEPDVDAMRLSGLAHFVAVSGSNVALFLAILFVATGPLALGPRRRALIGLLGLPLYAAATRFEPSVMRASVMAGIALTGRLIDVVLEAWQLLSLAVVSLLVFDPGLSHNAGFQLSVAATAGVLIGARWRVRGRLSRALAITMGAQLAVAPLLLIYFGSVPLMSPIVNLVAAPLVAMSTTVGAIGVGGIPFLVAPAGWLAGLVLDLARGAAGWPQLGLWELAGLVGAGAVVLARPRARPVAAVVVVMLVFWTAVLPGEPLTPGDVVVLDIGQGDAILVYGGDERFALIDGGPDPALLVDKLRDYRVRSIELMVLTHVHADHATGLLGVVGRIPIGAVWAATDPHSSGASDELMARLDAVGSETLTPEIGRRRRLGVLTLRVLGPVRRYASPNDQSIVLEVEGPRGRTMLLSGDIESFAQADLAHVRADVLKVPHQGAGTSDPDWLAGVGAKLAVISVGPNQFGHPVDWVIETLEESGAEVRRTDHSGDVIVGLS